MPRPESAPTIDPYEAFEMFAAGGEWSPAAERKFSALLESHEADVYMLYLNYKESGLVDELPEHERSLYEWLAKKFEDES
jgi:hypothetical protein